MNAIECTPLEFVGQATPYIYIGDSHALIGTLVFEDPATERQIATPTYTAWGFAANDVFEDGVVGGVFVDLLRRCSALHSSVKFDPVRGLRPIRTRHGNEWYEEHLHVTRASRDHPHVVCVGELDTRHILHRIADDEVDFAVPFPTEGLQRLPETPVRLELEFSQVLNVLLDAIGPIFRGLSALREAGLETLYLQSLPPPSLDGEGVARTFGFPVPRRAHYKLVMLVNFLYERGCRDLGIGFINTWADVTDENLRKPEYERDVIHLNRAATILSIQEVHRQFTAYTRQREKAGPDS